MIEFDIADIMLLVKSIKFPSDHFNICNFVQFCSHSTRATHGLKLKHSLCRSDFEGNFYFNRIPRLWNALPSFDITLSLSAIKSKIQEYFRDHFMSTFNSSIVCIHTTICVLARSAQSYQSKCILLILLVCVLFILFVWLLAPSTQL